MDCESQKWCECKAQADFNPEQPVGCEDLKSECNAAITPLLRLTAVAYRSASYNNHST